jgi:hypothetical protein
MRTLLIFIIATISMFVNGQESWLIDKNGCKVYNPHPREHESVEWTGDCIDSVANGYGQLIWYLRGKKTENVYTGNMINGRPEGKGKYVTDLNFTKITFEGKFKNGEIYYGHKKNINRKDSTLYIGELKNWEANGQGVMYFTEDTFFKGEFKDGYFENGIFKFENEGYTIESADWKYYLPKSGKAKWNDGTIYIGELKNFQPHGKGTVIYPDGHRASGKWKNGNLIKNGM